VAAIVRNALRIDKRESPALMPRFQAWKREYERAPRVGRNRFGSPPSKEEALDSEGDVIGSREGDAAFFAPIESRKVCLRA
jgi:hypothetical protein